MLSVDQVTSQSDSPLCSAVNNSCWIVGWECEQRPSNFRANPYAKCTYSCSSLKLLIMCRVGGQLGYRSQTKQTTRLPWCARLLRVVETVCWKGTSDHWAHEFKISEKKGIPHFGCMQYTCTWQSWLNQACLLAVRSNEKVLARCRMTGPYSIWAICLLHLNPLGKSPASTVAKPIWNLLIASAGISVVAVLREKLFADTHTQWRHAPIFEGLFQKSANVNSDDQLVLTHNKNIKLSVDSFPSWKFLRRYKSWSHPKPAIVHIRLTEMCFKKATMQGLSPCALHHF